MTIAFCTLVFVLIVRVSVNIGYRPVLSSILYGVCAAATWYASTFAHAEALRIGVASAVLCWLILLLLRRFDSWYLWWPVFIVGVLIPLLVQVVR